MGCGRSTLGSDSPKKNKRNADGDSEGDSEEDGCGVSGRKQQLSNKFVPFGAGGPLSAQAKISESQQDFFMMLDEKIENGPDYDSETEESERRRRLQEYAQQWTAVNTLPPPPSPPRPPDDDTCGSGEITEEDEDDDDELGEPGRIPDEAVREQYMFMGSVYTLTHVRTDADKVEPKVDIVAAPQVSDEPDAVLSHKLNGSAIPEEEDDRVDEGETEGLEVDDADKVEAKVDIVMTPQADELDAEFSYKLNGSAVLEEKVDGRETDSVEVDDEVDVVAASQADEPDGELSHRLNGSAGVEEEMVDKGETDEVDVVAALQADEPDAELSHKLNGSAVVEEKVDEGGTGGVEVDGKVTLPAKTSRPASLILQSVFPSDAVCD